MNLKSPTGKSVPNLPPTPSLAMTAVSISRYELLFVRTNQHFHVGPIIAALIGSGGNMQDCILVVCPSRKAFPKHHMLPAAWVWVQQKKGRQSCALWQTLFYQKNTVLLAWVETIPSPHIGLLLQGFAAQSPKDLFSMYLPAGNK